MRRGYTATVKDGDKVIGEECVVWLSEIKRRGLNSGSGDVRLSLEIVNDPDLPGKTFRLELSDGRQCDILIVGTTIPGDKATFKVTGGISRP